MPAEPYRVIQYSAVSTEEQADPSKPSLDVQEARVSQWCTAHGWPVMARIRVEGHSRDYESLDALCAACPPYAELVRLVRARAADLIACTAYDRLWRTDALRAQVAVLCRGAGVKILALDSPAPLDNDVSAFWLELMFGAFAEQENAARVARLHTGMVGRIQQGLSGARSRAPYGYRPVAKGSPFAIEPLTAEVVRWVFARRAEGWGYVKIARALEARGIPSPRGSTTWPLSTVRKMLHNAYYAGDVTWHKWPRGRAHGGEPEIFTGPGAHTPLVDRTTWEHVQSINRRRVRAPHGDNPAHLLTGLLKCAYCGRAMSYKHTRWRRVRTDDVGEHLLIVCSTYLNRAGCRRNAHHADDVHAAVHAAIAEALARPDVFCRTIEERQRNDAAPRARLAARIAEVDARLARLYDLAEAGTMPADEVARRVGGLRVRRDADAAELTRLEHDVARHTTRRATVEAMRAALARLDVTAPTTRRQLALALIERVVLGEDGVEIIWK